MPLQVIKVTIFATDNFHTSVQYPHRQAEIYLPIEAISHLTVMEAGSPHKGYHAHIRPNYSINGPFPIKSFNPVLLTKEQVEVLNK